MPIVLAEPHERLDDVMGLVSIHGRSAVVAIYDEPEDHLSFWYVFLPNPALENVLAEPQGQTVGNSSPMAHLTGRERSGSGTGHTVPSLLKSPVPCAAT